MNTLPELIIATTNAGKRRELAELLSGVRVRLRSLADFPRVEAVEETGETFEENAEMKSIYYGRLFGAATLADDSGLEVNALSGAPSVRSARYAGEEASDEQRVAHLLDELERSNSRDRAARFVCVVAIYDQKTEGTQLFRGVCEGRIAEQAQGENGFGYDPVFVPNGYNESFAQLSPRVKQRISHRAQALDQARTYLLRRFGAVAAESEITR
jgi:XTP/dITP diphosphohydrolase